MQNTTTITQNTTIITDGCSVYVQSEKAQLMKIAIASGKGGTGKTFVATNIFYTLTSNHIDAVLVDCDAEAPNAVAFFNTKLISSNDVTQLVPVIDTNKCTFCGKCQEYCNYNAIFILPPSKIINVIEDLCHGCGAATLSCLARSSQHAGRLGGCCTHRVGRGDLGCASTGTMYRVRESGRGGLWYALPCTWWCVVSVMHL